MNGARRRGTPHVTIRILGPFDVVKDGQPALLGGSRQRAVLAMLALYPNRVVSVDTLADELWTGSPPPGAATTLRGYVHHLRRALEGTDATIETRRPGYQLVVEPERIDAFRFERLVDSARSASADAPQIAADQYRLALALWRGPVLADFAYEPFAQTEITRLEEARLIALEERIAVEMRRGRVRVRRGRPGPRPRPATCPAMSPRSSVVSARSSRYRGCCGSRGWSPSPGRAAAARPGWRWRWPKRRRANTRTGPGWLSSAPPPPPMPTFRP